MIYFHFLDSLESMQQHFKKNWVIFSQILFTLNSGFLNLITFNSCYQLPSSHVTGLITRSAIEIFNSNYTMFGIVCSNYLMYLLGTIISGYFLEITEFVLTLNHFYMIGLQILILILLTLNYFNCLLVLLLSSLALGLQNGISSSLSNHSLRSTHFTGLTTDIGMCLGQMMKKNYENSFKFLIWISSLLSYFLGGLIATVCLKFSPNNVYIFNIFLLSVVFIIFIKNK
jgi:uncharacterized membrane protein YoaK (UPF0700 family)